MASAGGAQRMSRDEFRKKAELDELRKSGALEPEKDEEGKDINPHIPQWMATAPWYAFIRSFIPEQLD
jgi:pre-mRNA-processing factor SLU7